MYEHIFFNAIFNILYCLLNIFSLMNVCIFPKSSFCSQIRKDDAAQYFKIYALLFLGNSIKLGSNFSYIFFSISRVVTSTYNATNKWRIRIEKLNVKRFYLITFLITLIFSSYKVFEYKPNEIYSNFDPEFPFDAYDIRYCGNNIENIRALKNKCNIFFALNILNNFMNNLIFLFLSAILDIAMIRYSNKMIEKKRQTHAPHFDEALKYKENLNKMIILNGTLYFFSHIPEFLVTLTLFVFEKRLASFCFLIFDCTQLKEMAQSFHLWSMVLQFFVFIHFDHNLYHSLIDIWKTFKKK